MTPIYESEMYRVETEGSGARVLVTRLSDGATFFMQDEDATRFLNEGEPWVSVGKSNKLIQQYDHIFVVPSDEACGKRPERIVAGYHAYGYSIDVLAEGGEVIKHESYGNSHYDSTNVYPQKTRETEPLNTIKTYAESTAAEVAEEYSLPADRVRVFHDLDEERNLREGLGDNETETEEEPGYQGWANSATFLANQYIQQESALHDRIVALHKAGALTVDTLRRVVPVETNTDEDADCGYVRGVIRLDTWAEGDINWAEMVENWGNDLGRKA